MYNNPPRNHWESDDDYEKRARGYIEHENWQKHREWENDSRRSNSNQSGSNGGLLGLALSALLLFLGGD